MTALPLLPVRLHALTLLACLLAVSAARAGVVDLVSQTRFVDVNTRNVPGLNVAPADQRQDAPNFGAFDGSVSLSFPPGTSDTVTQHSTLTLTAGGAVFDAHGQMLNGASQNSLNGTTHFQVSFDLTAPEPFVLTYNGRVGDPRFPTANSFVAGSFTGPGAPGSLSGDPNLINASSVLNFSGTLQPGAHEILAEVNAIGQGSFDLNLTIGTTSAVPLPPAFWASLTVVPILAWRIRPRRLRAARAA